MGHKPRLYTVVAQNWEESERGWGVRPDGLTLHLTVEDAETFAYELLQRQRMFFEQQGIQGTPDEYTRTSGAPQPVTVNSKIYREVKQSPHGVDTKFRSLGSAGDLSSPTADIG